VGFVGGGVWETNGARTGWRGGARERGGDDRGVVGGEGRGVSGERV